MLKRLTNTLILSIFIYFCGQTQLVCTRPVLQQPIYASNGCIGQSLNICSFFSGSGISYQWRKNSIPIPGATDSKLHFAALAASDFGNYDVVATNGCGQTISNAVSFSIYQSPVITSQPVSQITCINSSVNLNVTATGNNLYYGWRKNGNLITWDQLPSITIPILSENDGALYDVVVGLEDSLSGNVCTVLSNSATIAINKKTTVQNSMEYKYACPGGNAFFIVNAEGTNLSYQWKKNGTILPGQTNSSLFLTSLTNNDAGMYEATVTGTCGTAQYTSWLTISNTPVIYEQPQSATICAGQNYTLWVNATGVNVNYQWRKNGIDIPGATYNTFSINSFQLSDAGNYDVIIRDECNWTRSSIASLYFKQSPTINSQPQSVTTCSGNSVQFTTGANGDGLMYQWLYNNAVINGATNSSINITNVNASNKGIYAVIIKNTCGQILSNNAILNLNSSPTICTQPGNQWGYTGQMIKFSVATYETNVTYQWRKNGMPINGAIYKTYSFIANSGSAGNYDVVISNGQCSTISRLASFTLLESYTNTFGTMDSILTKPEKNIIVKLVPNPASTPIATIAVQSTNMGHIYWDIVDGSGRFIKQIIQFVQPGDNTMELPLVHLEKGIYFLLGRAEWGEKLKTKFIKL